MFSQYKQEVTKYTKKDAVIALCFYTYACIVLFLFGMLSRLPNLPIGGTVLHIMSTTLVAGALFAIIILKKQGAASIGIHMRNLKPALLLGLLFSVFILLQNAFLPAFIEDWEPHSLSNIMLMLFYAVTISFMEDTMCTGYIQTRIYGLIKNDIIAVLVAAFLFAFIHVPWLAGFSGVSAFSSLVSLSMMVWIGSHIIWNLVFRRYFSLFPIMMMHIAWNMGNDGIFITNGGSFINNFNLAALILAVVIWLIIVRRKAQKTSVERIQ